MYAGRVVRQDRAKRFSAREKTQCMSLKISKPAIENFPIEISRKPVEHASHLCQHRPDFLHVPPRQHMRQAGRRRNLTHVIIRRLRHCVERKHAVKKVIRRPRANVHQFSRREVSQRAPGAGLIEQVAANQSGIRLTDFRERFARPMVRNADYVEAGVGLTLAKKWNLDHGKN